jgi:hypothetical protein
MGLLALLDEECLFPKATDQSYADKVHANHQGRSENYAKPGFSKTQTQGDFIIYHYAGVVRILLYISHFVVTPTPLLGRNCIYCVARCFFTIDEGY